MKSKHKVQIWRNKINTRLNWRKENTLPWIINNVWNKVPPSMGLSYRFKALVQNTQNLRHLDERMKSFTVHITIISSGSCDGPGEAFHSCRVWNLHEFVKTSTYLHQKPKDHQERYLIERENKQVLQGQQSQETTKPVTSIHRSNLDRSSITTMKEGDSTNSTSLDMGLFLQEVLSINLASTIIN